MEKKSYLITGGTGSFGQTMINHLIKENDVERIIVFSRDEKKQDELRNSFNNDKLDFYIGDVRDKTSINNAMKGVNYVFHAAALKQVPSCEFFPMEAVKTNIIGTSNVIDVANHNKVKNIVCLSTDKAAYPINSMGMSKALLEKVAIAFSKNSNCKISVTRYGNVMASRGSVIPLFLNQAINNKPLTVTNSKMTRFLMNLNEAVNLVLFAFNSKETGNTFIYKSPASTIKDLATAIIELTNSKSVIKEIGIRHGEKMYETLCTKEEMLKAEDLGKFYKIPSDSRSLNYNSYVDSPTKNSGKYEEYNSNNTKRLSIDEIKEKLLELDLFKKFKI